ncbi:MAG TPA: Hpt domain-containing protein [Candidatus Baltobacteraceae bacterium]|jgi:HPt (histidine-containing phosphotransfer) domain-containing protein
MTAFNPALVEEAFEDDVEGTADFIRSVIGRVRENCERIRSSARAGDAAAVHAAAHAAKGSAGHLGGADVEKIAARIELSAKEGTIETSEVVDELEREIGSLEATAEAYITSRAAKPASS